MNSCSHYAFGSVAEWIFVYGLGIDTEDAGFRNIFINPAISDQMNFMEGSYQSINGEIKLGKKRQNTHDACFYSCQYKSQGTYTCRGFKTNS